MEQDKGYQSWTSNEFDFSTEMYNQTNTLYLRFPFEIEIWYRSCQAMS